ncbi:hypothetical protein ACLOJK_023170 [Asimina triloba]
MSFRFSKERKQEVGFGSYGRRQMEGPPNRAAVFLLHPVQLKVQAYHLPEGEDGNITDCVDIYEQLAFDQPALRNHTIQVFLPLLLALQIDSNMQFNHP